MPRVPPFCPATMGPTTGSSDLNVTWVEVWGTQMTQMVTAGGWAGWAKHPPPPLKPSISSRVQFANAHYKSTFHSVGGGSGLAQSRTYTGLTPDEAAYVAENFMGPTPLPPGATIWDESPPTVYLDLLGGGGTRVPTFANDAVAFFGDGGIAKPAGVLRMWPGVAEGSTALLASVPATVPANGSVTLRFCFGYAGKRNTTTMADALRGARRAFAAAGNRPLETFAAQAWAAEDELVHFESKTAPRYLVDEMKWHSFYLRASVTYDEFFGEHIVDQGTAYRYFAGFQGAIRDPLQHVFPVIHTRPDLVRSVIRYSLKELQPNIYSEDPDRPVGLPDSLLGSGVLDPNKPMPDDFEVYLMWTVSEYLLATKDLAFLSDTVTMYNSTTEITVLEGLERALNFTIQTVGLGEHSLLRLLTSDWDDGFKPPAGAENVSESVLTSSLAAHVLPRVALVLRSAGGSAALAKRADDLAVKIKRGLLEAAWNGHFLRRAWLGPEAGWAGDTGEAAVTDRGMYSSPLGFAMMAGLFADEPAKLQAAVSSLTEHCRDKGGWHYGYAYRCNISTAPLGAGMWPAMNHPMVMGLASTGHAELAWEEFLRNTMQWQATVSPAIWVGIWTSADTVDHNGLPGPWTYGFPALCTHRHAYPLVSLPALLGITVTAVGLRVRPTEVAALADFDYRTRLVSLRRDDATADGWDAADPSLRRWSGSYAPLSAGFWEVSVDLGGVGCLGSVVVELSASADADAGTAASKTSWTVRGAAGTGLASLRSPIRTRKIEFLASCTGT